MAIGLVLALVVLAGPASASHLVWVDNPKATSVDANWHQHDTHANLKVDGWLAWGYQWCWNVVGEAEDCTKTKWFGAIYVPKEKPGGGCVWNQPLFYFSTISGLTPETTYDFRLFVWIAKFTQPQSCSPPQLVYPLQSQNFGNICATQPQCRITTLAGSPDPPPRGGSPRVTLYDSTGNWTKETNVLPQAESYQGPSPPDWEDALQLGGAANATEGLYMVEIHEWENAENSIDRIRLSTIDFPSGYSVAVAPDGSVHSYSGTVAPNYAINSFAQNVLPLVTADDGNFYQGPTGDTLTVGFGAVSGAMQKIVLSTRDNVVQGCGCYKWGIPIQIQVAGGGWNTVTTLYPRVDERVQILDLTGLFVTGSIDVRLSLRAEHQIDWVGLDRGLDVSMTETTLLPTQVNYSDGSPAVLQKLLLDDGIYFTVAPGFYVLITFSIPLQLEAQRVLVLRVNGFYAVSGGEGAAAP